MGVYQISDFIKCRDVVCRVSIAVMLHKAFNISSLSNPVVVGVSKFRH